MANLDTLPAFLRAKGLTVVEVQGWFTRGYAGQDLTSIAGVLWHHTATHRSRFVLDAPTLNMCVNGRPDLPGPLCNIVFGRNGTVYMVATGVANHAGAGSAPGIPKNLGNHFLVGIEMESSGIAPWDWTADQIRVAPRLGAAIELWGMQHLPPEQRLQLGHMEYSSQGKIDPAGWPGGMDGLRAQINAVLNGEDEDDMPSAKEVADEIFSRKFPRGGGIGGDCDLGAIVSWYDANNGAVIQNSVKGVGNLLAAQNAQVTNLIGALGALAKGEQFDEAKLLAGVQAAAAAGVKDAIESIDTSVTVQLGKD